ncbi:MAG: mannose-1-phosphate guanylyltransferase, partial [Bacteroidia bacterium]|nr:mannose-1-phosphate guanylyltransferase [Bacteroidia bacterium]
VEKPHLDLAKEYLTSGDYLWNSGQFVWKISTIMKNFESLIPNTYDGLVHIGKAYGTSDYEKVLYDSFQNFKSESIDYAIMEHADNIYTIPGNFGWDDVGSWLALERFNRADECGNIIQGDVVAVDSKNNIICGNDRTIAVVGLEDIVIVQTDDAILVCSKDSVNDIKKVVNQLKVADRTDLL